MSVRVRFAPSPTGSLHVGGARTALFNYLFARKQGGRFVIRIEDTDQVRHQEESVEPILQALKWLKLDWDEGPFLIKNPSITGGTPLNSLMDFKGDFGPYRQSERLSIYKSFSEKLIDEGKAYYCFLKESEVDALKQKEVKLGRPPKFISPYREKSKNEALEQLKAGHTACIRFKLDTGETSFSIQDMVRGTINFPLDTLGDFILMRSDGFPVYNFACAIDDSLMEISHVFRGEEHLPNTLRQVLIQEALGFQPLQYGHLSLILGEDKKKLSKREQPQNIFSFKEEGFLPEALVNFFALLGWNPGTTQEYFSKEELIKAFSIERVNAAAAVFDQNKLSWLNSEHLKNLDSLEFWKGVEPFFEKEHLKPQEDSLWREKTFTLLKHNFKTFKQAVSVLKPLLNEAFFLDKSLSILSLPESRSVIKSWKSFLEEEDSEYLSLEEFQAASRSIMASLGIKGKAFFKPLRLAVLGAPEGMEIKTAVCLIKRKELIQRSLKALS